MIVSRRYSLYGTEFAVSCDEVGALSCTCKEFCDGRRLRWDLAAGAIRATCRHIRTFERETKEPPEAAFTWATESTGEPSAAAR